MNKVRKNKRKKINLLKAFFSIIIIWLVIIILYAIFNNTYSYKKVNLKTIYVSSGDTLWSIARIEKNNNEYYKNMEIREIVSNIKKINSLESSSLYENQELKIMESF